MIFFYGTRHPHIKSKALEFETCPKCGQQGGIVSSVYGRYAHLFWIPVFPLTKKTYTRCAHCNSELSDKQLPEDIGREVRQFSKSVRTPVWYFSGLFLLAALIIFGIYSSKMTAKETAEFMANPQIGDCYYFQYTDDNSYSTMRIEAIEGDSVYFDVNKYAINKYSKIDDINKEENFAKEDLYPVAKTDLNMKKNEKIILKKVRRRYQ